MKLAAILVFIFSVTVYSLTTAPYLQAGDSTEMAVAAITLGVPHQPSYPLYVLSAHLLTKLPIPYLPKTLPININGYKVDQLGKNNILIYRAGLASALFQAAAATYVFLALLQTEKVLDKEKKRGISKEMILLAAIATFLYAFSTTIWLYATKPEVFGLNNLFAASLIYYALSWYNSAPSARVSARYLFLLGLAFSHHQTIILIFPALFVIFLLKKQQVEKIPLGQVFLRWFQYPFDRKFNKSFPLIFCFTLAIVPYFIVLWLLAQEYPFLNWGEISGPVALVRALIRADYGSIGAYLTNIKNPTVAIDQIPFFANRLVIDFSLYTLIIAILGTTVLYRKYKDLWAIELSLFLISGPIFLMYANFALDSDFSKATVIRFYLIPELAVILVLFTSISMIYHTISELKPDDQSVRIYKRVGKITCILFALALLGQSLYKNRPMFDNLTYSFAKTAIKDTEENAIILVTGDIPNMTMQYMEAVEGEKKNRIIFSPGQFHLKWFQKQLKARYPELKIPSPLPGKEFTSPSQVIDANFGKRPLYIVTDFVDIDPLIQQKYVLWPKNLLLKVEKAGVDYKLEPYLAENDKIFQSLNSNEFKQLREKKPQLESPLVFYYSRHFYNLGAVFNSVHKYEEAIIQFQRALTLDPELADAYKALGYMYYFTPDYADKNPELATKYLYKYLETTKGGDVDQIISVQNAIKQILEDSKKAQQGEIKKQSEASMSAEASSSASNEGK